ncbi:hypothetical protein BKA80DRAFT_97580, partial [Phyllosticta citrichinensis]
PNPHPLQPPNPPHRFKVHPSIHHAFLQPPIRYAPQSNQAHPLRQQARRHHDQTRRPHHQVPAANHRLGPAPPHHQDPHHRPAAHHFGLDQSAPVPHRAPRRVRRRRCRRAPRLRARPWCRGLRGCGACRWFLGCWYAGGHRLCCFWKRFRCLAERGYGRVWCCFVRCGHSGNRCWYCCRYCGAVRVALMDERGRWGS